MNEENKKHPLVEDMEEAQRETVEPLNEGVVQEATFSSLDLIEVLRRGLIALPEYAGVPELSVLFCNLESALNMYDASVRQNEINVLALTQDKADDKELQRVGAEYGMSMNQTVGFMDMCEQLNINMEGAGVIAVPFWFHDQYLKLQVQNKALIEETNTLMATLARAKDSMSKSKISELGLDLPERRSIITGLQTPYIAGETGARLGDEHLDHDHIYLGDVRSKR